MTGPEIKAKIDDLELQIRQVINPGEFVLNQSLMDLLQQEKELRMQCPHEYENRRCIYCYKKEG